MGLAGGGGLGGPGRGSVGAALNSFPSALANALPNSALPSSQLPFPSNVAMPPGAELYDMCVCACVYGHA